ncbi:MAG TPA: FAD-binding oxidoreductase [Jatrophihabitantaceae bacterium]|jgi:ferredoxin-NADP reductase|nr:FAD-binding oxidoreductase [Jatrophihabitantaceae bacterium]
MAVLQLLEALATPHGVDRYLELVNPMLTVRELRAEITDVRRTTADSVTLTLRPTRQWKGFRAGQFVQLTVDVDGVRRTRCYSPANSQYRADGKIELTVRAHHGGLVSRHLFATARRGMVVGLAQADGAFVLPEQRPDRILLISGGSGITPVMSMLRTLREENYAGQVAFLHYCDSTADVPYLDELAGLDGVVLATTRTTDGQLTGRFGQEHLDEVAPWFADAQTYLCGPPALMSAVRDHYAALGLADRLHTEDFQPAPIAPAGEATGTVTFARSGTAAANSGDTLLVQAEAAGLDPEYGCRMGICFSCTQVKTSGCTRNVLTGELNSDPDVEVQLCINAPVGDVALDI